MDYAFTITLLPKHYTKSLRTQYRLSLFHFNNMFEDEAFSNWRVIEALPEVTKSLNLHIHGVVKYVGEYKSFYPPELSFRERFRNHQYFGFVYLKQITNYPEWINYIYKDQNNPIVIHLKEKNFIRYWKYIEQEKTDPIDMSTDIPYNLSPLDNGVEPCEK